ncbi:NAD-dependent epimerase [Mariniphaga sediminis]|uniref:NAD-dependent epimerase n=1 Tax=Mariniphaga sediminis TaxID=1628158 RepID=A0A399DB90_9BACT|nr:NAD-dependent epimerase [Mariniphaga sediminis]RIH67321.1 NAD-dependent epimerase [Mariniphaga sediminis]
MKILVTGSAGFIGFHLVNKLLKQGASVVGIDNINDYYSPELKFSRLREAGISKDSANWNQKITSTKDAGYSFVRMNLEDREALNHLFETENFDFVCNLAAQAGVRYSIENPHAYINSNIAGFMNILEACRHHPVKHLVYASSSSVYGNSSKMPLSTSDPVDHPISLYAATKKSNELMAYTYSHLYNIPATGLRFFTVYGPWGRPDMAYFLFTRAILEGTPIKVFNHGDLYRDFTYIDDIVEGVVKVLAGIPAESPPYQIYNIGNSTPVKLLDFIETIEKALGKKAVKEYREMQPGDVYKTFADVSDLQKNLGYSPDTPLEKGIGEFVKWYNSYFK